MTNVHIEAARNLIANCYGKISESKKQSLKDRSKQIRIAKKKGLYSPYMKQTVNDF